MRDFLNIKGLDKSSGKSQESHSIVDGPRNNHFYALRSMDEQESFHYVMTGML